jgi:glycosyltransferase involved in cell wall biosynthesis
MKILFLLTQDLESPSGLGRYWPMARALANNGHQVYIAALHPDFFNLQTRKYSRDNVSIEYVAQMHVKKAGSQKEYFSPIKLAWVIFTATLALIKTALSTSADIINVCKPHPMNSIAGYLASKIRGSVLCIDCDDYEAGSNRFSSMRQRQIVAYFETKMPNLASLVSTNTIFMKEKLQNWGCPPEHILYLPNGIDEERFFLPDPVKVNQLRMELSLEGKRVVLYLGTMSLVNHPVDLLLKAFVIVHQEIPDAILLLVGGGEDYQKLIDQSNLLGIRQFVHATGKVDPEKVPYYYAIAEVSIDPVYDNDAARGRSPLKLFESWMCGVPFVTAAVGDREYLLGDPPAGRLADQPGDPKLLAVEIIQVLRSREIANELITRGRERVKNFTWGQLVIALEKAYAEQVKS